MIKCFFCKCDMNEVTTEFKVNWKGKYPITISGLRAYQCPQCNDRFFETEEAEMIQKLAKSFAENNSTHPKPDYLNVDEVADILRISNQSVYNMIKDGRLIAHKIGREWRFKREDIQSAQQQNIQISVAARGDKITSNDMDAIKDILSNNN